MLLSDSETRGGDQTVKIRNSLKLINESSVASTLQKHVWQQLNT